MFGGCTYLNSTKVPLLTGHSTSARYRRTKFTNSLYLFSPNQPTKLWPANCSPSRYAVSPFSAKEKSNKAVTGSWGVPSCSCCLAKSEPPTKPIAHLCRRAERIWSMAGDTVYRMSNWRVLRRGEGDNYTSSGGECTVDVEEADCTFDGTIRQSGIDTCSFGHGWWRIWVLGLASFWCLNL